MSVTTYRAEPVWDVAAALGEGPIWDARRRRVWFVDILGGRLHAWDEVGGPQTPVEFGQPLGCVVRRARGGVVVAARSGLIAVGEGEEDRVVLAHPAAAEAEVRYNDGKCDPAGRFWVGTLGLRQIRPTSFLYRVEADLTSAPVLDGISVSNGIAWSADGATMYYIDTPRRRVDVFDYDLATGAIRPRRVLPTDGIPGVPDGMAIDRAGRLWIGMWEGWAVVCLDPASGQVVARVEVPAARATACAFGGADGRDLYITTAAVGVKPEDRAAQPLAGGLFRARVEVGGEEWPAFAG